MISWKPLSPIAAGKERATWSARDFHWACCSAMLLAFVNAVNAGDTAARTRTKVRALRATETLRKDLTAGSRLASIAGPGQDATDIATAHAIVRTITMASNVSRIEA